MPEKIRFEKHVRESTFRNPLTNNELDTQELEIRRDPLTGAQSVFNPRLEDKVAMFYGRSDPALIEKLARDSETRCFLCGDRWREMTPQYPEDLIPGGRIRVGQAVLFPNIFPAAQVHAVIRVGDTHYVPLGQFDARIIEEALQAALQFSRHLADTSVAVPYLTINGNYLGPAGASIAHPHFQVVGGDLPFTALETLLDRSRAYYRQHGTCYWSDLVKAEQAGAARFIGNTGPVQWLSAFSPQGSNEVVGILPERSNFLEFDEADSEGLAQGLAKVLHGYAEMGISTFNFTIFSGILGRQDETFRSFIRIISRQNVYENYRTDDYFLQKLLRNELILTTPEALAGKLRPCFS